MTWTGSRVTQTGGVDMGPDDLVWIPGARRFEYGGRPVAYDVAMAAGIAYVDRLSVPVIAAHARALASALRDGLGRAPGACVRSPNDPALAAGIVTVALAGVDGVTAAAALRERWRIVTCAALRGTSVRVSLAPFVEEGDVARLLESLAMLTAGR